MSDDAHQFWFRSDLFAIDPHEDEETNPFRYGKQLARWIADQFRQLGYSAVEIIPEDWGWCVMLEWRPFMLWIGCGNVHDERLYQMEPEEKAAFTPRSEDVVWTCSVDSDVLFWTPFFWKRLIGHANTNKSIQRVASELAAIFEREEQIQLVEEP